ncbi:MAG: SPOR domain-containing protein [Proteobacteria bacterium]|nr:SPOR domain-containing protein [Pseudomonadota bacterium]
MNQGTKQRIVGTVVLLALALIFLPIIFDGQGSYQDTISSRIPAPPTVPILAEPVPTRPVIIADTDAIFIEEAIPQPGNSGVSGDDEVQITTSEAVFSRVVPSLDRTGLPEGWSVRLGSFSDSSNAKNLVARLQMAGYRAYTRNLTSDLGELAVVYVGPWIERARVDDYQKQLQEEFQLAGLVVRYEVEQL